MFNLFLNKFISALQPLADEVILLLTVYEKESKFMGKLFMNIEKIWKQLLKKHGGDHCAAEIDLWDRVVKDFDEYTFLTEEELKLIFFWIGINSSKIDEEMQKAIEAIGITPDDYSGKKVPTIFVKETVFNYLKDTYPNLMNKFSCQGEFICDMYDRADDSKKTKDYQFLVS